MRYLHTMVRVRDLIESLDFYCIKLGLEEIRRMDSATGRFTLVFLATTVRGLKRSALPYLSSPTIGTKRIMDRRATSAISPLRWTISMRSVSGWEKPALPSTGRRATDTWPSSAHRTTSLSKSCKKGQHSRRASPGPQCPTPERGELLILRAVAAAAVVRYSASVRVGKRASSEGSVR